MRWRILALLFSLRTVMAVQFQSVAAVGPALPGAFGISLADVGLLIGIYFAPGLVIALPGGSLGNRFGDRRIVVAGLALMAIGGVMMALSGEWAMQLSGRLVAGTGGVLLNVLMTKMVTDWFTGREIATAMAIFVTSWPVGIALALVLLPHMAEALGIAAMMGAVALVAAAGAVLMALGYRAPATAAAPNGPRAWPAVPAFAAIIAAGGVWALYNTAFGVFISFAPLILSDTGLDTAGAASLTSLAIWIMAATAPLGGIAADWTGRRGAVILVGLAGFAVMLLASLGFGNPVLVYGAMGLMVGLPAGAIMSLPSRVLTPATRASGMGAFYTVYYIAFAVSPWVAGWLADATGTPRTTFLLAVAMLALAALLLWAFSAFERRCRV